MNASEMIRKNAAELLAPFVLGDAEPTVRDLYWIAFDDEVQQNGCFQETCLDLLDVQLSNMKDDIRRLELHHLLSCMSADVGLFLGPCPVKCRFGRRIFELALGDTTHRFPEGTLEDTRLIFADEATQFVLKKLTLKRERNAKLLRARQISEHLSDHELDDRVEQGHESNPEGDVPGNTNHQFKRDGQPSCGAPEIDNHQIEPACSTMLVECPLEEEQYFEAETAYNAPRSTRRTEGNGLHSDDDQDDSSERSRVMVLPVATGPSTQDASRSRRRSSSRPVTIDSVTAKRHKPASAFIVNGVDHRKYPVVDSKGQLVEENKNTPYWRAIKCRVCEQRFADPGRRRQHETSCYESRL